MKVWKMVGDKPQFFAMKDEARDALREYRKTANDARAGSGPEAVDVHGREELAALLNAVVDEVTSE